MTTPSQKPTMEQEIKNLMHDAFDAIKDFVESKDMKSAEYAFWVAIKEAAISYFEQKYGIKEEY